MSGHLWSRWKYDRHRQRWYRHCTVGAGKCTAVESVPRGHKPKEVKALSRVERLIGRLADAIVAERLLTKAKADRDAWRVLVQEHLEAMARVDARVCETKAQFADLQQELREFKA